MQENRLSGERKQTNSILLQHDRPGHKPDRTIFMLEEERDTKSQLRAGEENCFCKVCLRLRPSVLIFFSFLGIYTHEPVTIVLLHMELRSQTTTWCFCLSWGSRRNKVKLETWGKKDGQIMERADDCFGCCHNPLKAVVMSNKRIPGKPQLRRHAVTI